MNLRIGQVVNLPLAKVVRHGLLISAIISVIERTSSAVVVAPKPPRGRPVAGS